MQLTQKVLQKFMGGQLELQNPEFMRRGKITLLDLKDGSLVVGFAWLAQRQGKEWVKRDPTVLVREVAVYECDLVGGGEAGGPLKLVLYCRETREYITLYNLQSKSDFVDPREVRDLHS